ncbi:HEAT repeat domain-containing protein [Sphingobacterium corticis]|uniref:HEAT repeat domain-containing protein n=1 Tax=Sphingobacterium corticis TaxID=1812823 RepID=A0ABW5NLR7_9SPHI
MFNDLIPYFRNTPDLPIVIKIAMVFVVVAIFATLIAYLSILRGRYLGSVRARREAKVTPLIDDLLIGKVLANDKLHYPDSAAEESIADYFDIPELDPKWARQILIDRIVDYRKNIRGSMGEVLRNLYLDLELDKDTHRKLKSGKWNKRVQALNEFVNMGVPVADVALLPLTNSRNMELRAAARHAYIKLSRNEPFKFFDVVSDTLLPWDQIELFRIITTTEKIVIPNFARWITYSANKSVVSFCLKLVVHFNQVAAIPAIIKLLGTKDHYLRADAIIALGKLEVDEVEHDLVNMYNNQPLNCQIEILRALSRLRGKSHVDFVMTEFLHATDFEVRKSAARALLKMHAPDSPVIQELLENSSKENQLILRHCMNPLIKH